jgi:hypothetical protein
MTDKEYIQKLEAENEELKGDITTMSSCVHQILDKIGVDKDKFEDTKMSTVIKSVGRISTQAMVNPSGLKSEFEFINPGLHVASKYAKKR